MGKIQEQEQAYIVPSQSSLEVAKDLATRSELGIFKLSDPQMHEIVDTYYDTPDNYLRMGTVTLRTRVIDGELLVTFKGKEKVDSEFTQDHAEIEFAWPSVDQFGPETIAELAGLVPVQRRETLRVSRKLIKEDPEGESELVGELNVDSSLYTLSTGEARVFEVEVERQGEMKLKKILTSIEEELPYLVRWQHGKFVTGKAIEFAFGVQTNENFDLTDESFGFIDAMFGQLKIVK